MFQVRILFLSIVLTGNFVSQTFAETPPVHHGQQPGRIVEKADGQLGVFWGLSTYLFPKRLQEQLRPYLGKFVDVEYTLIPDEPGTISIAGYQIGTITKVDVHADDPAHLPIVIEVQPTKAVYELGEPVAVHVAVTNHTEESQSLSLGVGGTALYQNYEPRVHLEWLESFYSENPAWGLPKGFPKYPTLSAGQTLEFDVSSAYLVWPGTYQVIYKTYGGPASDYGNQSEAVTIKVAPARDPSAEHEALKKWLTVAAYPQRVEIAEQLLRFNDTSGTDEVLRLLDAGVYSKETRWEPAAFRYAWKKGGLKGQQLMLNLIKRQGGQELVERLLDDIGWCPDYISCLDQLLDSKNLTSKQVGGWVEHPRICDLTAAFLGRNCSKAIGRFPTDGTEEERDEAIIKRKGILNQHPELLGISRSAYGEDKTLGDKPHVVVTPD